MENTPSVAMSRNRASADSLRRASSSVMSRLAYRSRRPLPSTNTGVLDSRMPSMMLAWFNASEMTASSVPSSVSNSPVFASKHELYRMVSSVPRNADSRSSSRLCPACVPQMNRTDAIP